ncbi:MAG TPA: hypothetical protein VG276_20160 [Actinomycetes bacterium]|jgi:hypothetical protein|nr:hypothetical protein [Actinomycetes bacterium]
MASNPENLPLAEQPPDDQALLARTFWLLLDHGRPVEVGALAATLEREPAAVAAAVDRLEQAGMTRRDPAGRLLGSHGLSVAPTHHELLINGRRRCLARLPVARDHARRLPSESVDAPR